MAKKKRQHIVPRTYLSGFCDPTPPPSHPVGVPYSPAVWVTNRDSLTASEPKSPQNILWKSYFYNLTDGAREPLQVENALSTIETPFPSLRERIEQRSALRPSEWFNLTRFVGALFGRTERQVNHMQGTADEIELIFRQVDGGNSGNEDYSDRLFQGARDTGKKGVLAAADAMAHVLLTKSSPVLLVNNSGKAFITSDSPAIHVFRHIDELEKMGVPRWLVRPGATVAERAFVTYCPLTPRVALLASPLVVRSGMDPYVDVSDNEHLIENLNRLV